MKQALKILLALVVACVSASSVYYYVNRTLPFMQERAVATTVSQPPATEKPALPVKLCALEKEGFTLYRHEGNVILEHNGKQFTFNNWSSAIDEETPQMYYFNADDDEEKEVIVRAVTGTEQETGNFVYDIYVLDPAPNEENYDVRLLSQETWRTIVDRQIVQEITQLKTCKKIVQIAMTTAGNAIAYDKATGIATECGYQNYFRALQDENGNYLTVNHYSKGKGLYFIKNNKICIQVDVQIAYNEITSVQYAGTINFEITLKDNNVKITEKSLQFLPDKTYRVADPRVTAQTAWRYTEQNSNAGTTGNIQWLKYALHMESDAVTQTFPFVSDTGDIQKIASIQITQDAAVLTAAEGASFVAKPAETGEFSVIINSGTDTETDIAYTAALDASGSVLTIHFDKAYAREEMKSLQISYGSK